MRWLVLVALAACRPALSLTEEALVSCTSDRDCPSGTSCRTNVARCVADDHPDDSPPALVATELSADAAAPGAALSLTLTFSEPLSSPPAIEPSSADVTVGAPAALSDTHYSVSLDIAAAAPSQIIELVASATDAVGNSAVLPAASLTIDATPPTLEALVWEDAATVVGEDAVLRFSAEAGADATFVEATIIDESGAPVGIAPVATAEDGSGVEPVLRLSGIVSLAELSASALRISVRLTDALGNVTTGESSLVTIDTLPPSTTLLSTPPASATALRATFTFTSPDPDTAAFECSLDGAAYSPCASPYDVPLDLPGAHTFAVRAKDGVGLVDPTPESYAWSETRRWAQSSGACAVATDGSLWCWGENYDGELGLGFYGGIQWEPSRVGQERDWSHVANGSQGGCGIRGAAGDLHCWGTAPRAHGGTARVGAPVASGTSGWTSLTINYIIACGTRQDGSAWCFGTNDSGQLGDGTQINRDVPVRVGTANDWLVVNAGMQASCGVRDEGGARRAYCWGSGNAGNPSLPRFGTLLAPTAVGAETGADDGWLTIGATNLLSCGLREPGELWCWGRDMGAFDELAPVRIGTDSDWTALRVVFNTICGLRGGAAYCLGTVGRGLAADRQPVDTATPVLIDGSDTWVDLALSDSLCLMNATGDLSCRSSQGDAALGRGRPGIRQATGLPTFTTLRAGPDTTCGVDDAGQGYCWGFFGSDASYSIARVAKEVADAPEPLPADDVVGPVTWLDVAGVDKNACAVVDPAGGAVERRLYCWGHAFTDPYVTSSPWTSMDASTDWQSVVTADSLAGDLDFHCGLRDSAGADTLWCWGENSSGQLGIGNRVDQTMPQEVVGPSGILAGGWLRVSLWRDTACGIRKVTTEEQLYCWGSLGDGSDHPARVGTAVNWRRVAVGFGAACGVRAGGALWCWGDNDEGQLGDGTLVDQALPSRVGAENTWAEVTAGEDHFCAQRDNGDVLCWGANHQGQANPASLDTNLLAPSLVALPGPASRILAGHSLSCAEVSGDLFCWGDDTFGQAGSGVTWGPHMTSGPSQ